MCPDRARRENIGTSVHAKTTAVIITLGPAARSVRVAPLRQQGGFRPAAPARPAGSSFPFEPASLDV